MADVIVYPNECRPVNASMNVYWLASRLKKIGSWFHHTQEIPRHVIIKDDKYIPLIIHLSQVEFMNHQIKSIQLLVACSISYLLRLVKRFPYENEEQLKAVIKFFIKQLQVGNLENNLDDADLSSFEELRCYKKSPFMVGGYRPRYRLVLDNLAACEFFRICFQMDNPEEIDLYRQHVLSVIYDLAKGKQSMKLKSILYAAQCDIGCQPISPALLKMILINVTEPSKTLNTGAYGLSSQMINSSDCWLKKAVIRYIGEKSMGFSPFEIMNIKDEFPFIRLAEDALKVVQNTSISAIETIVGSTTDQESETSYVEKKNLEDCGSTYTELNLIQLAPLPLSDSPDIHADMEQIETGLGNNETDLVMDIVVHDLKDGNKGTQAAKLPLMETNFILLDPLFISPNIHENIQPTAENVNNDSGSMSDVDVVDGNNPDDGKYVETLGAQVPKFQPMERAVKIHINVVGDQQTRPLTQTTPKNNTGVPSSRKQIDKKFKPNMRQKKLRIQQRKMSNSFDVLDKNRFQPGPSPLIKTSTGPIMFSNYCGYEYKPHDHLEIVVGHQIPERFFKCTVCNTAFETEKNLNDHQLAEDGNIPDYCDGSGQPLKPLHLSRTSQSHEKKKTISKRGKKS